MASRRRAALSAPRALFTAEDVARFCEVDAKTIHAWAARGLIPETRTQGRHRRFRRSDVVRLLRAHGYPLHVDLRGDPPRLAVFSDPPRARGELEARLRGRFELVVNADPIGGLLELRQAEADALLLFADGTLATPSLVARLRSHPATRHLFVACVAPSASHDDFAAAGADVRGAARELGLVLDKIAAFFAAEVGARPG